MIQNNKNLVFILLVIFSMYVGYFGAKYFEEKTNNKYDCVVFRSDPTHCEKGDPIINFCTGETDSRTAISTS